MGAERGAFEGVLVPVHRAGWPFIGGALLAAVVLGFLWGPLFWPGLLLALFCAFFFRDPPRVAPTEAGVVSSPADGRISRVGLRVPPAELGLGSGPLPCVSVFLNVFDVHVNRTPVAGRIARRAYHPGKFLNAALDKASEENERQSFAIETNTGAVVGLVQIAGLVARRIVGFVDEGAYLRPGERVGLIRFGSRCDVYLPCDVVPIAIEGQRAVAGETIIARLDGPQRAQKGYRS